MRSPRDRQRITGKRAVREKGAQAVNRALSLLERFSVERPSVSLTEAAQESGLTLSTTYRILKTLLARDFVVRDEAIGRYTIGPAILRLARVVLEGDTNNDVLAVAIPHLERLRNLTGETAGLHVPYHFQRLCIGEMVSRHPLRMASGVGQVYPLYAGAAGKTILAFIGSSLVEEALTTTATPPAAGLKRPSHAKLLEELAQIREHGYAMSFGETIAGASAVAAVVRSSHESPAGAINITGPASRWTKERMLEHLPALVAATREIEARLGYRAKP